MKQTIYAPNTVPTANIAVNKSRLKVYKNAGVLPTYYIQKGTEFQIELANPTTDVVLAKITLNGKLISQGGLVLNPGQRIYLDRYLDVAKKFLFDTYEVSNSNEMKQAIAENGDIKVEFYRESQPYFNTYNGTLTIRNGSRYYNSGTDPQFLRGSISSSLVNCSTSGTGGATTYTTNGFGLTNMLNNASYSSSIPTMDFMDQEILRDTAPEPMVKKLRKRSMSKSIETGRVEKGSDSNQTFKYVNKTFDFSPFHTVEYKMLPISQKINIAQDINVKVYCTQCGHKLGRTDRFCSSCGKKA
jgi:hypothetical protein